METVEDAADTDFYWDLQTEDDIGFILKAHLHIELQLVEFITFHMKQHELCDWSFVSYKAKVQIALGLGLHKDLAKPLARIGKIRNDFAHLLNHKFSDDDALKLFHSLEGSMIHRGVKHSFSSALGRELKPAKESFRDLFTVIHYKCKASSKSSIPNLIPKSNQNLISCI